MKPSAQINIMESNISPEAVRRIQIKAAQDIMTIRFAKFREERKNKTFYLDDYISQRKESDSDFAAGFDSDYEEFKIGMIWIPKNYDIQNFWVSEIPVFRIFD